MGQVLTQKEERERKGRREGGRRKKGKKEGKRREKEVGKPNQFPLLAVLLGSGCHPHCCHRIWD